MQSQKLKKAIMRGNVTVINTNSGEVKIFLYNSKTKKQFSIDVPPCSEVELAPRLCTAQEVLLSRNIDTLLQQGQIKIKS